MNLDDFGFDHILKTELEFFRSEHDHRNIVAGRVTADYGGQFLVQTDNGPYSTLHGSERFNPKAKSRRRPRPTVGDWVWLEIIPSDVRVARVLAVAERKTLFTRPEPGTESGVQTIAANMDFVLLLTAANDEFNLARIGRYLTQIRRSGAEPVLVLTKSDLSESLAGFLEGLRESHPLCHIFATSCESGFGIQEINAFMQKGKTFLMLGSSGVGKSTLLNALCGKELMRTGTISGFKDQGRHTTSHREMIVLPQGALLIDGPGLRSLGVDDKDSVADVFSDVVAFSRECKYSNCRHGTEPDCAVQAAIKDGELSDRKVRQFIKLFNEAGRRNAILKNHFPAR